MIVFPEMVVPRWTEATDLFWQPTLDALASSGKTISIGTTFTIPGHAGYENGIAIRGSQTGAFLQHIPVPISMWNPLVASSVPLDLSAPFITVVDRRRAAILICYELFLTWPLLRTVVNRPEILVATSNDYWSAQSGVSKLGNALLTAWARLLRLPAISACNL